MVSGGPVIQSKECTRCRLDKPLSDYRRHRTAKDGLNWECRACHSSRNLEIYRKNRDGILARNKISRKRPEIKRLHKDSQLRIKYGLTLEAYEQMLASQGGGCAICHGPPKSKRGFHVDHDHKTGKVRAILCGGCNVGIGYFYENPKLLIAASKYLELHGAGVS